MASKKKGNDTAARKAELKSKPQDMGKRARYAGMVNTTCPCGKSQHRGMVSVYNDVRYCGEACVRKFNKAG